MATARWTHSPKLAGTKLGKKFSEGARQLWLELERRKLSIEGMRKLLGFARGNLNKYLYGRMKPGIDQCARIEDVLGIPCRRFADPPRRPFVLPAARPAHLVRALRRAA